MRIGLLQLTSSDNPGENLARTIALIRHGASKGARFIATPEVTNCVSTSRTHQTAVLQTEGEDRHLEELCGLARSLGIWLSIGSLALKSGDRFVNRSFMIDPRGEVIARYDKIHMFDVEISPDETYRESDAYTAGDRAVMVPVEEAKIGLSICYDLRFPQLYRALAQAGATVLLVPAAFSAVTGEAHWHTLLRARAIETGCFIVAAAQVGTHPATRGKSRQTYGHSLVVNPWGEIISDAGTEPRLTIVDLDLSEVDKARQRIPSLSHDRDFEGP
ncbi:carbon-nitrogen hydrolase family protein [Aestuariibius insulae]|uniref:carbon-nitrogen hydrolase family protein n=1 Tax=Aestuariibius insulae TaxID=2058287 RepID=UPI00345E8BB3